MAFWNWSKTAGDNATADPSINFATGMSPSAVSPSARAMMASLAQWGADIGGALTLGGTATAYTVATNEGLSSPPVNGQLLAVTPNTTNGIAPTLSADSGTAYPIQSSSGTALGAGVMLVGTPYLLSFSTAASAWVLLGFAGNPYNIPLGGLLLSTINIAPNSNFVFANGQAISRTTYATYFAAVSTTYGSGDGTSTFNVPDLRGRYVAGLDGMGGSGVTTRISTGGGNYDGTVLGNAGGTQSTNLTSGQMPQQTFTPSGTIGGSQSFPNVWQGSGGGVVDTGGTPVNQTSTLTVNGSNFTFTGNATTIGNASPNQVPVLSPSMVLPIFVRIF